MSEFELLVQARKYIRASISKLYNTTDFDVVVEESERRVKLLKVQELREKLSSYDDSIFKCLIAEESSDQQLHTEAVATESYQDKLRELLVTLRVPDVAIEPVSTPGGDTPRSLLKSPTAPLPKFHSKPGENLETFLVSFEETLSKFNYTEYDKLLLLKQQIDGRGCLLYTSPSPRDKRQSRMPSSA